MSTLVELLKEDKDAGAVLAKFEQLDGVTFKSIVSAAKTLRKMDSKKFKKVVVRSPILATNLIRKDRENFSAISNFILELTGDVFLLDGVRDGINDKVNLAKVRLFADCVVNVMAANSSGLTGFPKDWIEYVNLAWSKPLITNNAQDTTKGAIVDQNRRKLGTTDMPKALSSIKSLLIKHKVLLAVDDSGYSTELDVVSEVGKTGKTTPKAK
jgi:hypothetical protein